MAQIKIYRTTEFYVIQEVGQFKYFCPLRRFGITDKGSNNITIGYDPLSASIKAWSGIAGDVLDKDGIKYGDELSDVLVGIKYITVQNPFPIDGDSIYSKDLDIDESSIGGFSGAVTDLFDSYYGAEIIDSSGTNPKTYTLAFKRPIWSNKIGMGSLTGNFSNVKIMLKDLTGTVRTVIDDSANNTKYTSFIYPFTTNGFIQATIEFHTSDAIKISGMFLPKVQSRTISSIDGYISETNSTNIPLGSGATFTGTMTDTLNYGMVVLSLKTDVVSATDGLSVQYSPDGTNWDHTDDFTIPASTGKTFSFQTAARFLRVVYTNGVVAQSYLRLQTTLKPVYVKPSSHRLIDTVSGQDDAELVKANITAEDPIGDFVNIKATTSHNLRIADAEDNLNIAQGNVIGTSAEHKFGRGANIDTADGMVVLWDGSEYNDALKTYTFSSTADIDRISSDDDTDTQDIEIQGLDTNWDFVTQTKTLTGQTPVALDTSLIRVFRVINVDTTDLAGSLFCFVNVATTLGVPNTITNTRAMINNGNNQTLMSIYTIPAGKTAYILNWYGALSSAKASSFNNVEMRARSFGQVFQLKHTSTLSSAGTSHIQHFFSVPQSFPEKTDFMMLSDSSVNDNAVSAGFDMILVDD